MQISVFVFTVKRVYVVLMVCDDDLLIHGWVLRCDQMNIHQHKSSQVANGNQHVRQASLCMSALVTVRPVFCREILYVHLLVNIKGRTCKTAVVSANQLALTHAFIRVWDDLRTWGVLTFLILFLLALYSSVSSNYTSIYYWVNNEVSDRECLVIATKGNRAHLNKSHQCNWKIQHHGNFYWKGQILSHDVGNYKRKKRWCFCLYPWLCVCGWTLAARYSRLSFRCVLWYGNGVAGVGELRRSGSRHHGEHGGSAAAAQTIESHHA